jgi:hypothetical protein
LANRRFTLDWISLTEVSFDIVNHIPVSETSGKYRAISCYDGTDIPIIKILPRGQDYEETGSRMISR